MNKIFATLLCFLSLSTSSYAITFFHEDGTPVTIEELRDGQKIHPDVCLVELNGDKAASGTGVFLSPNVVMTARHVVCSATPLDNNGYKIYPESYQDSIQSVGQMFIKIQNQTLLVDKVELFEDGHEDIALIILKSKFEGLAKFRTVKASSEGDDISEVSVMGYGNGRVISEGARVFAELDDLHQTNPQLRFRNHIKPPVGEKFTINRDYFMSLNKDKAKTYSDSREYPTIRITSKNIRILNGDSGGPLFDSAGDIIGVASHGPKHFIEAEQEFYDKYHKFLDVRPYAFKAIMVLSSVTVSLGALAANYYAGSLPIVNTIAAGYVFPTIFMEDIPLPDYLKTIFDKHLVSKNYEKIWTKRNAEIIKSLKEEKKVFGSTYVCFRQDTVDWINSVLSANTDHRG